MKKLFKNILNVPVPYVIAFSLIITTITLLSIQGVINTYGAAAIVIVGILFALRIHLGSIVTKSTLSILVIFYVTSVYTTIIAEMFSFVTQPFMLTLAAATLFLAQSYNVKFHNFNLRSRPLWSLVLVILLVIVKIVAVISGTGYWLAETISLVVLISYIIIWRFWLNNSKKTKLIKPDIIEEKVMGKLKYIYINTNIDIPNYKWIDGRFTEPTNAYPYIYNEVIKAREAELILVIVSKLKTDNTYDVGRIKINDALSIPYLYMEAKTNEHEDDILSKFIEEITRNGSILGENN